LDEILNEGKFKGSLTMRLDLFDDSTLDRGRPAWVEALWLVFQALFVSSWLPGSRHRRFVLRLFGAKLGKDVVIKPGVRVKFPWRLQIGDHSWVGEDVWIDNLAPVTIGSHCCLSQGVYLCTGNHDWRASTFDLITAPITICDKAWLGAKSVVGPGVTVGEGAALALGSVAARDLKPWWIYQGNPAVAVKERKIQLPVTVQ
jgi:putative colanic acid biosynthesis acetyltransferase WcaF